MKKHSKTRTFYQPYSTDGMMSRASGGWTVTAVAARLPRRSYATLTWVRTVYVR